MNNITSIILDSEKRSFVNWKNYIPSVLSAFFSVFFSISIVLELKTIITGFELVLFGLFILFFLVYNEKIKFKELNQKFRNQKYNLFTLIFTFMISISLSTIGIYLWTNKTTQIKNNQNETVNIQTAELTKQYNSLITNIENKDINLFTEYQNEHNNLTTWKKRSALDMEERKLITSNIEKTQNNLLFIQANFNNKKQNEINRLKISLQSELQVLNIKNNNTIDNMRKNDFISYLFILLTLIVEFATINFNKELSKFQTEKNDMINSPLANTYKTYYKILYGIYTSKTIDNMLDINDIKYSPANTLQWNDTKVYFNLLNTLKVINICKTNEDTKQAKAKILMNESDALNKLTEYFNRIIN
jgi:hypothetical protein